MRILACGALLACALVALASPARAQTPGTTVAVRAPVSRSTDMGHAAAGRCGQAATSGQMSATEPERLGSFSDSKEHGAGLPGSSRCRTSCISNTRTGNATCDGSPTESTFVEKKTADGQDVRFRDDPVSALAGDPIGAQLTGFHPPRRFDLMRPRYTFVPEMLKSIVDL